MVAAYVALTAKANERSKAVHSHESEQEGLLPRDSDSNPDHPRRQDGHTFDLVGAVSLVLGLFVPMTALAIGGEVVAWTHPAIATLLVISPLIWLIFIRAEQRASAPIIPLKEFKDTSLILTFACTFLFSAAHNSVRT